jgi:hypothetical protein
VSTFRGPSYRNTFQLLSRRKLPLGAAPPAVSDPPQQPGSVVSADERIAGEAAEFLGSAGSLALQVAVWELLHDARADVHIDGRPDDDPALTDPDTGILTTGQTAILDFWGGDGGRALIHGFHGGPRSTRLGNWLAATLPNLFGRRSKLDLTGKTNLVVATLLQTLLRAQAPRADAQLLATALGVYASTESLGGRVAERFGFQVTGKGVGASCCNVGPRGAPFGVPDGSTPTVLELLRAADRNSPSGRLLRGDAELLEQAGRLFELINQFGGISG